MQDQNQPSPEIETDETALDSETIKELNRKGLRYLGRIALFFIILTFLIYQSCQGKFVSKQWQEEVQLNNGDVIWVQRGVEFISHRPDPITREGGMLTDMQVIIDIPNNPIAPPPPQWKFNAVPIVLDYDVDQKTWVIIATAFYCYSWSMAGKPPLMNWQYVVKENQWIIIPLDKKYIGRNANLFSGFVAKTENLNSLTIEDVKNKMTKMNYKSVKRVMGEKQTCDQSINYKAPY